MLVVPAGWVRRQGGRAGVGSSRCRRGRGGRGGRERDDVHQDVAPGVASGGLFAAAAAAAAMPSCLLVSFVGCM